mmetsp:Transcript_3988/g.25111  ORF Transcript_3988/g.25111 Transcript_3988/m.25111 type:complete len:373 (-) Transcript_3988:906-2024(-)
MRAHARKPDVSRDGSDGDGTAVGEDCHAKRERRRTPRQALRSNWQADRLHSETRRSGRFQQRAAGARAARSTCTPRSQGAGGAQHRTCVGRQPSGLPRSHVRSVRPWRRGNGGGIAHRQRQPRCFVRAIDGAQGRWQSGRTWQRPLPVRQARTSARVPATRRHGRRALARCSRCRCRRHGAGRAGRNQRWRRTAKRRVRRRLSRHHAHRCLVRRQIRHRGCRHACGRCQLRIAFGTRRTCGMQRGGRRGQPRNGRTPAGTRRRRLRHHQHGMTITSSNTRIQGHAKLDRSSIWNRKWIRNKRVRMFHQGGAAWCARPGTDVQRCLTHDRIQTRTHRVPHGRINRVLGMPRSTHVRLVEGAAAPWKETDRKVY